MEQLIPTCEYQHEHCHAICDDCYSKARELDARLRMVDFVSGPHNCCYCHGSEAKRWITQHR